MTQDRNVLLDQLVREYISDQLETAKENSGETGNSFIVLDNHTINMLLTYLLLCKDRSQEKQGVAEGHIPDELLQDIEAVIESQQQSFEDIISLLKNDPR
ncbi:hypothetical protein [Lentibacillus saliphilus]|uniref:hypothetical protein n=1 Tax=Lentibacillus saliphilus TaxID=2737028 RepID=UPI001C2F9C91|nr:hypothetical protein [Lentibacillus saliphilus]